MVSFFSKFAWACSAMKVFRFWTSVLQFQWYFFRSFPFFSSAYGFQFHSTSPYLLTYWSLFGAWWWFRRFVDQGWTHLCYWDVLIPRHRTIISGPCWEFCWNRKYQGQKRTNSLYLPWVCATKDLPWWYQVFGIHGKRGTGLWKSVCKILFFLKLVFINGLLKESIFA